MERNTEIETNVRERQQLRGRDTKRNRKETGPASWREMEPGQEGGHKRKYCAVDKKGYGGPGLPTGVMGRFWN